MSKYRIIVNGEKYELEIEEISDFSTDSNKSRCKTSNSNELKKTDKNTTSKNADVANKKMNVTNTCDKQSTRKNQNSNIVNTITSPLPGRIDSIKVAEGESVIIGQVIVVVEAMKMFNEILAKKDGIIERIYVSEGDLVAAGDSLFGIR